MFALVFLTSALFVQAACAPQSIGDIQVAATSSLPQTVSGANVGITTVITGADARRLEGGVLAVIVRTENDAVADRFLAIPELTGLNVPIVWRVPASLATGRYTLSIVAAPADTAYADIFTDPSLPRGEVVIAVAGEETVTRGSFLSDELVTRDIPGTVYTTITNDSDMPYKGEIIWSVRAIDAAVSKEPILTYAAPAELHPHTSQDISYTLPNAAEGSYYVEARMSSGSVADSFLVSGVAARDTCAAPSDMVRAYSRLWQALGLVALMILGALAWSRMRASRKGGV